MRMPRPAVRWTLATVALALLALWFLRGLEQLDGREARAPAPTVSEGTSVHPNPALEFVDIADVPAPGAVKAPEGPTPGAPRVVAATRNWRLEVTVVASGGPLPEKACAVVLGESGRSVASWFPEDGAVRSVDVQGRVRVFAAARGLQPWAGPWVDPPERGTQAVKAVLDAGDAVEGIVLDQRGLDPVSNVRVAAMPPEGLETVAGVLLEQGVTTDEAGRFRMTGIAPGAVRIRAVPTPSPAGAAAVVDTRAGDSGVRILLSPLAAIDFLLVDALTGLGADGSRVELVRLDGVRQTSMGVRHGAAGGPQRAPTPVFRTFLPPGASARYQAFVEGYLPGDVVEVAVGPHELASSVRMEMRPAPGTTVEPPAVTLRVRRSDGSPATWLAFSTRFGDGSGSGIGWSHDEGVYDLSWGTNGLETGERTVWLDLHDYDGEHPWMPVRLDFDLRRGDRIDREVVIRRAGFVRIRAAGSVDFIGQEPASSPNAGVQARAVSGRDGEGPFLQVGPLTPGERTLVLQVAEREVRLPVVVPEAGTVDATLRTP